MASAPKPSGENWSRVANSYTNLLDVKDELNPAGAACREILDVVDKTLPFAQASYIMDMGTGSGPVISAVLDSSKHAAQIPPDARIVGADVADGLLDMLKQRKQERQATAPVWKRLEVVNWDGRDLSKEVKDGEISHLLSSYAYMAFRDEGKALAEAYRTLKPGGLLVETSMGFTEWGHLVSFFKEVRPDKRAPGPAPHWGSVEGVKGLLESAGFREVQVKEYDIGIPVETAEAAVEIVFQAFAWVKEFIADMSEEEVARSRQLMLEYVRSRHAEAPMVLTGTGLVGWGRK